MEYRMDLPPRGNMEVEGCARDDFLYFKGTSLFHLEFLGSVHMEVGCFKPHFLPNLPWRELGGYSFLHRLLGYFVGGLGIVLCCR